MLEPTKTQKKGVLKMKEQNYRKITILVFLAIAGLALLVATQPLSKAISCNVVRYTTTSSDAHHLSAIPNTDIIAEGDLLPTIGVVLSEKIVSANHGEKTVVYHYADYDSTREFYENYGITVGAERADLPGWYACELPAGWHVQRDGKDIIHFYTADDVQAFCLAPQGVSLA